VPEIFARLWRKFDGVAAVAIQRLFGYQATARSEKLRSSILTRSQRLNGKRFDTASNN
jgi:hypothetical protein